MKNALDIPVFQCPDCKAALQALDKCGGCGRAFEQDDGSPVLFPNGAQDLQMTIQASMLNPGLIPKDQVFRFPPASGQSDDGVYHLDRAHMDVIDGLDDDALVLEVGCGGGQMREWISKKGLRYIGTDVSKTRVHDWLAKFGGADVLCDVHALPFKDNSVDLIYASAVWEHLAFPQMAAAEVRRVLKPGGVFLGSVSFLEPWHDESYYHASPNGMYNTLAVAGLMPQSVWPEESWPGFRAMLQMGNKPTQVIARLGNVMNWYYLFPKKVQMFIKSKRWPDRDDLYETIGRMSGAITWIAHKPNDATKPSEVSDA